MITDISQLDSNGTYTYADYLKWQFDESVEFIKGKLYRLHTVVQPDLCVLCTSSKLEDAGCLGAPDWAIEIKSPRTAKNDLSEKFNLYEESGVCEYWIVQPKEQAVNVDVLENGKYALVDVYESDDIPSRIFPDLIVSPDRLFR